MSILIRQAELNGIPQDIWIEDHLIKRIGKNLEMQADQVIDALNMAVIPGLINMHTHSAMTLFRGFGGDVPLFEWLEKKIWPYEAKLTGEDIYWGSKLACLEMIKTGTTCFLDMYFQYEALAQAVEEMGLRAYVSSVYFDHFNEEERIRNEKRIEEEYVQSRRYSDRINFSIGPHAIYTVSAPALVHLAEFSRKHQLIYHIHLSETEDEVQQCLQKTGMTPVAYLDSLGVLSPLVVAAHVLHVTEEDMQILRDRGVNVVHNPNSNLKLASGMQFKFEEMSAMGIKIGMGTDGCASSNNLDMVETMKVASLLGKAWRKRPEVMPASNMLKAVTAVSADILGLNAGRVEEGRLADLALIDLKQPAFVPNFDFEANLVYAANGSCVDTLICNGKVLMLHRKVEGEEEIMEQASRRAFDLIQR